MRDQDAGVSPDIGVRLEQLSTPALADCGHDAVEVLDATIKPIHQACEFVGIARTVRLYPDALWIPLEALEAAGAGDVIVVDAGGQIDEAVWGNLLSTYAAQVGIRAVVTNGAVRDVREVRDSGFPAFARETVPTGPSGEAEAEVGIPVTIDGVSIPAGRILVGDEDGIVVIERESLEEVVTAAEGVIETEADVIHRLKQGESLRASMEGAEML